MTDEECLELVKNAPWKFEKMENKTEKVCLEAVKRDGLNLRYVENQTEQICLEAIKENVAAFEFVKIPLPEIEHGCKIFGNAIFNRGYSFYRELYFAKIDGKYLFTLFNFISRSLEKRKNATKEELVITILDECFQKYNGNFKEFPYVFECLEFLDKFPYAEKCPEFLKNIALKDIR